MLYSKDLCHQDEQTPMDTAEADASGITSFYEYPTFVGAQRMSSEDIDSDQGKAC